MIGIENVMVRKNKRIIVPIFFLFFLTFSFSAAHGNDAPAAQGDDKNPAKYVFSTDWVTPHIPVWKDVLSGYRDKPNVRYLEIGVFEGRSLIWMLENILTHPTARAVCIDPYSDCEYAEKRLYSNLRKSGFRYKVKVIKGFSQFELRRLPLDYFDIIYIDGSHIAPDVLTDGTLSWMLLKNGGILIFDDYRYDLSFPSELRPRFAIDSFITAYRNYIEILHSGRQVIIRKQNIDLWDDSISPLGGYKYRWRNRVLYDSTTGKAVDLNEEEKNIIEEIIESHGFGEVRFHMKRDRLKDEKVSNLIKRLNLNFIEIID